jgi:hypothetical protein
LRHPQSKSIADVVVAQQLPKSRPGHNPFIRTLSLPNRHVVRLAGMHLMHKKTLRSINMLDLSHTRVHDLQHGVCAELKNLVTFCFACDKIDDLHSMVHSIVNELGHIRRLHINIKNITIVSRNDMCMLQDNIKKLDSLRRIHFFLRNDHTIEVQEYIKEIMPKYVKITFST